MNMGGLYGILFRSTATRIFLLSGALFFSANATALEDESMQHATAALHDHRYELALAHFQKAAELGNVQAQRIAGMMLLFGEALYGSQVTGNRLEAIRLLEQASRQGCDVSSYMLTQLNPNHSMP